MYVTAFNATSDPITVDGEGRVVHGGDYGTVETTFDGVRDYLAPGGGLVQVDVPEDSSDVNPRAQRAAARTAAISSRADELAGLDKDVLAAAAAEAGVPAADELDVAALRSALAVRTDVPIPAAKARRSRAADEKE
jgi:hypothetical protein